MWTVVVSESPGSTDVVKPSPVVSCCSSAAAVLLNFTSLFCGREGQKEPHCVSLDSEKVYGKREIMVQYEDVRSGREVCAICLWMGCEIFPVVQFIAFFRALYGIDNIALFMPWCFVLGPVFV